MTADNSVTDALASVPANKATEWKVRIASLASFAGSLALGILLEVKTPDIVAELPEGARVIAGAALVAAGAWLSGRAARSRPEYISQSTVDAVRDALQRR